MILIPISELPNLCPWCSQLPDACKASCSVALTRVGALPLLDVDGMDAQQRRAEALEMAGYEPERGWRR